MAWAKQCDICKKFFSYDPDKTNEDFISISERTMSGMTVPRIKFDTCPACMGAIHELIETIRGNNDEHVE